ncbi:MAG: hypothetical protein LBT15_01020 [Synergistaceae bacterium]|jgi:ethanolamine utilization cobalamin adenosyltransferase|nr:hypothetical protein [Synergistaceae bacterium]
MEKREHTTFLSAGSIVGKADLRIEFRGRLDTLCAEVVDLQVRLQKNSEAAGCPAAEDLD